MENPVVTIEMENGGIITAELYPDVAPQSVYNFISLANSGFYESLAAWLESQTRAGDLPVLPKGKKAQAIEAQSTGYLFTSGPDTGKYQIQCRLQYFQEV